MKGFVEEDFLKVLCERRGIENICKGCNGSGTKLYANTSTWQHGIGGQAMTVDVCEDCWGTGDENKKGFDLRRIKIFKDNEKCLRKMLWLGHGCPVTSLYSDDGEMQCGNSCHKPVDFKRDGVGILERKLLRRRDKKLS